MGVCAVVAELAEAVAEARGPLGPRHALMVHVLRSAPVYSRAGRLDAWEGAYQDAGGDDESHPVDRLLDAIFSLGRHNLYVGFDEPGTADRYRRLARDLAAVGVPVPHAPDVSGW